MTTQQKVIKNNAGLLELTKQIGNSREDSISG